MMMMSMFTRFLLYMLSIFMVCLLVVSVSVSNRSLSVSWRYSTVSDGSYSDSTRDHHHGRGLKDQDIVGGGGVHLRWTRRSRSPAVSIQAVDDSSHVSRLDLEVSASSNITQLEMESLDDISFANESKDVTRDDIKLDRLEAGLQKARTAIRDAILQNRTDIKDQDFVPRGPMYWNPISFLRSYLEMEKQFKIYVYEEGEPPLFHDGPCKSIYSSEGNFIHMLEMDRYFRTKDAEKAHVLFLPFSVTMLMSFVYNSSDSHGYDPLKRVVVDYVNVIAKKYPYWNRSVGADHFMLSCHDKGPKASRAVPDLAKNSIRVLCNANTSRGFVPSKDVSLPEINLVTGNVEGFIGGPPPSDRTILAFFAGGRHGKIRPILLNHWENKDPEMQVHQYLPKEVSYYKMMRKSKFCLCPSGFEVASPRIVEALYVGCVPVLISRSYIPPFSDVLNWKTFSVIVSVEDIPNLKEILSNISTESYMRMHWRGVQVRRHFVVNFPPKRFDVYHMILHSIWLRRLNIRIQ